MRLFPIASDGWRFIIPLGLISAGLIAFGHEVGIAVGSILLLLTIFCLFFFRDFDVNTPIDDSLIYSPGDGKIIETGLVPDGEFKGFRIIRIFLSVFDVHVQRTPVSGHIEKIAYKKGTFLDARHPNAHIDNEQNAMTIISPRGKVVVIQIAGLIARRIVCWVKEGQQLIQGNRYGLIRFGSQVDLILPLTTEVRVKPGDRVVSGKTILAAWSK